MARAARHFSMLRTAAMSHWSRRSWSCGRMSRRPMTRATPHSCMQHTEAMKRRARSSWKHSRLLLQGTPPASQPKIWLSKRASVASAFSSRPTRWPQRQRATMNPPAAVGRRRPPLLTPPLGVHLSVSWTRRSRVALCAGRGRRRQRMVRRTRRRRRGSGTTASGSRSRRRPRPRRTSRHGWRTWSAPRSTFGGTAARCA
mmetsp:Transcript_6053/g.13218  ORF Transcript_6053/g.13218 Transcript_6053/m.13218 type:complete len:200 (+) Transcript_6053:806-1405(+)